MKTYREIVFWEAKIGQDLKIVAMQAIEHAIIFDVVVKFRFNSVDIIVYSCTKIKDVMNEYHKEIKQNKGDKR